MSVIFSAPNTTPCYDWACHAVGRKWLTSGGDLFRVYTESGSLFACTSLTIAELEILGDLLAFLIQSPAAIFTTLGEMTDADKVMNLRHMFGNDPADASFSTRSFE